MRPIFFVLLLRSKDYRYHSFDESKAHKYFSPLDKFNNLSFCRVLNTFNKRLNFCTRQMYCGIKIQHLFINGLNYDRVQRPFIDTMLINYRSQNTRPEISNGYSHTQFGAAK